jgi:hypothetical protein
MPLSFDTLRVGHRYEIINLSEKVRFIVVEIRNESNYIIKDLGTLEILNLFDLIKFGKGKDYDLYEIDS